MLPDFSQFKACSALGKKVRTLADSNNHNINIDNIIGTWYVYRSPVSLMHPVHPVAASQLRAVTHPFSSPTTLIGFVRSLKSIPSSSA